MHLLVMPEGKAVFWLLLLPLCSSLAFVSQSQPQWCNGPNCERSNHPHTNKPLLCLGFTPEIYKKDKIMKEIM